MFSGVIAVHEESGTLLPRIRRAVANADLGLQVEPAAAVDLLDVPEIILFEAPQLSGAELSRFSLVVNESGANRAAVLVISPVASRHDHLRWIDAGAWSVLPLDLDETQLLSHLRAALRMVRGARETPDRVLQLLRDGEERNRAILEAAVDGIISIDEHGLIDSANPAAARMFGYQPSELLGSSVSRLMPAPFAERHDGYIQRYLETGENRIIGIGREAVGLRRDGSQFPLYLAVSEFRLRGRRCFTGIVRDISELKQAEATKSRLAIAVHQAAEAIVITDSQATILYVNPAFTRNTGYGADEVLGNNPRILKSGQHTLEFYQNVWHQLMGGKVWSGHVVNRRKDGTLIDVHQVISPILGEDGAVVNFVSVWRDVTREMQLEEQVRQAQKMESIGRLAGGVAHDFNNLLTAILGLAGLAREKLEPSSPAIGYIDDMIRAARRSSRLTQQLLSFSRKHLTEIRPLRINEVVMEMEPLLCRTIGEDIEMVTTLDAGGAFFEGDSGQIGQVLMNLVVNARDAMPLGGQLAIATASVDLPAAANTLRPDAKPGRYVVLSVRDGGVGMTRDVLQHIFEPFYTTKPSGKGTGLGLAMVYGIVRQHGGFIEVDSELGRGTEFRIYLPCVAAPSAVESETQFRSAPRGHETILLVEDEEIVRRASAEMLATLGYHVLVASSPDEALVMGERGEPIHLLISDVVMPRMNGHDLARCLTQRRPDLRVLLVSGFTADSIPVGREQDRRFPFLNKPFTREELGERVRAVLDALPA